MSDDKESVKQQREFINDKFDMAELITRQFRGKKSRVQRGMFLSSLDAKRVTYIRENMLIASRLKDLIKDEGVGKEVEDFILEDIYNLSDLTRCEDGKILNAMLTILLGEDEMPEDQSGIKGLLSHLFSNKKGSEGQ